jgi:hypothetical protein
MADNAKTQGQSCFADIANPEGGHMPEKCCMCVGLELGWKIMAILTILGAILTSLNLIRFLVTFGD